jgi:hypothetical protein
VSLSREQRRLRASGAAYSRWSYEDPRPAMEKVREGRLAKLENRLDPDHTLNPTERRRRAKAALAAEMKLLALKSSRARARRKAS